MENRWARRMPAKSSSIQNERSSIGTYLPVLLGAYVIMAAWLAVGDAHGQTKHELLQRVKSYRAQISDIDVSWTYINETLADDPMGQPRTPIPKMIVRRKQRGIMYWEDSVSWRIGREEPTHFVSAYDGEKLTAYDVDHKRVHISSSKRPSSINWIYQVLKWPQGPKRSPYSDLARLVELEDTAILPDKETAYGVEMVVLKYGNTGKLWLDMQHGGIVRKNENRQSVGGPLLRRTEVPELHDVNGIFVPARIVRTASVSEKNPEQMWNTPVWRYTVTIPKDTLKLNSGLTKEDFQFEVPAG